MKEFFSQSMRDHEAHTHPKGVNHPKNNNLSSSSWMSSFNQIINTFHHNDLLTAHNTETKHDFQQIGEHLYERTE